MKSRLRSFERGAPTFAARLTSGTLVLLIGVLFVTGTAILLGVRESLQRNLDSALLSIARTDIASAIDAPSGRVHIHDLSPVLLSLPWHSGYENYVAVEDYSGRVLAQTANLARHPALRVDSRTRWLLRTGRFAYATFQLPHDVLRTIYYPLQDLEGRPLIAIVAVSQKPLERAFHLVLVVMLLSLLVGGLAAAAGASRLAERLTRPLQEIVRAATSIREDNLSTRIPDISDEAELHDVTRVLNAMLVRLEAAFDAQQSLISAQQRFVADASHELRSPLSNLRGTVEVALRRPRSETEYRETLSVALTEIERLSRLVQDLLTLSRADAGQFQVHPTACDLNILASRSVAVYRVRAGQADVRVDMHESEKPVAHADEDRIRQVLDNLLDNALRYSPAGSVVDVRVARSGDRLTVSVQDSGPGIAPEDLIHVFDRFYRADLSRGRQSGGMGLGLAIARAIAEAHGGQLSVTSRLGAGTTFVLELPAEPGVPTDSEDAM
jgi:two-component system OmpR family sensor kinase